MDRAITRFAAALVRRWSSRLGIACTTQPWLEETASRVAARVLARHPEWVK
jgi:hypothetical protein